MSDTVIKVENVSKKFCRNLRSSMMYGTTDIARNMLGFSSSTDTLRKNEFWALEDISFELKKAETLGIIGINGSGKSTLLRLLNGIYPPDKGRITVKGAIGALIAVGAGFHPHMTGRENIYLNGTILGMTRKEIDKNYDSIVDFADIGEFLEAPVSTYSSGMYVRLGFSIAIHSDPEILLIDEVLSVGDLSFQNKCLRKIFEKKQSGTSFLFVSHAMDTVRIICDRILLLDHGRKIFEGDTDDGIMKYNSIIRDIKLKNNIIENNKKEDKVNVRSDNIDLISFGIIDKNGIVTNKINYGEDIITFLDVFVSADIDYPAVAVGIKDDRSFNIIYAYSLNYKWVQLPPLKANNKYRFSVILKNPNIKPGVYGFNIAIANSKTEELYLHVLNNKSDGFLIEDSLSYFAVEGDMYTNNAVIELKSEWNCEVIN